MTRKLYVKYYISLLYILIPKLLLSQMPVETWSNYSAIDASKNNPSLLSSSFCYAEFGSDFNINLYNDFYFLNSKDYTDLLRYRTTSDYFIKGKNYPVGFVLNTMPKNMHESSEATAFSAMFCPNGTLALGMFINARACSNATNVPYELPEIAMITLDNTNEYFKNFSSRNCNINAMVWNEIGISVASTIYDRFFSKIDCGISAKLLLGISSASMNIKNLDYDLLSKDSVFLNTLEMVSAVSLPTDLDTPFNDYTNIISNRLKYNGLGFAFDFGFSYTEKMKIDNTRRRKACAIPITPYFFKIGVSLLDFGAIRFRSNSITNVFSYNGGMLLDFDSFNDVSSYKSLVETLSMLLYEDDRQSFRSDNYFLGLPSALSVQFDARLNDNIYVNASWIQPVRFFTHSVMRSPQIVLAPRYESRFIDCALPISLLDYHRILVGLSARFSFVSIGTHNLLNLIGLGDSYGLDLYVSLRYHLLKGRCNVQHDACWASDFR